MSNKKVSSMLWISITIFLIGFISVCIAQEEEREEGVGGTSGGDLILVGSDGDDENSPNNPPIRRSNLSLLFPIQNYNPPPPPPLDQTSQTNPNLMMTRILVNNQGLLYGFLNKHAWPPRQPLKKRTPSLRHRFEMDPTTVPGMDMTKNQKRSPRCLRRCLQQGMLHPSQCHSLC